MRSAKLPRVLQLSRHNSRELAMSLPTEIDHGPGCLCAARTAAALDRRWLLRAAGAGLLLAAAPPLAQAQSGKYEAMILACIDPRTQEPVCAYAAKSGLTGKYSQFVIAGAAIGVVAPKFSDWHQTFWDNLAASVRAAPDRQGHRDQSPRLWRRKNRLWRGGGRRPGPRDRDAPQGTRAISLGNRASAIRRWGSKPG